MAIDIHFSSDIAIAYQEGCGSLDGEPFVRHGDYKTEVAALEEEVTNLRYALDQIRIISKERYRPRLQRIYGMRSTAATALHDHKQIGRERE